METKAIMEMENMAPIEIDAGFELIKKLHVLSNVDKTQGIDGKSIVSEQEEKMAIFLKERNLEMTNVKTDMVYPVNNFYTRFGKRFLDILIAAPVLLITLPLNLVFAFLTYLDVGKPILYKQKRTGKNGKSFTMVKFRNMNNTCDEKGALLPASERVTKFGKFMRKTSFDELLNFWNVLKGDMSIIGPRPYPEFFTERMSDRHKCRHFVRPGIECPKMISLPNEKERKYQVKLENDIWYVQNISFANDIKMCFKLIGMVFSFDIRKKHAGALSYFVGYDDEGYALGSREAIEFVNQISNGGIADEIQSS